MNDTTQADIYIFIRFLANNKGDSLVLLDVGRVGGANLLDDSVSKVVALGDRGSNVLTLDELGNKSTAEGISSTVTVNNLVLGDGNNGVLRDRAISLGNNGAVDSLGEDNKTLTLGVDLGELGNVSGNSLDILGVGQVMGNGIGLGLTLVTKDNIHVGHDLIQDLGEELGDEGSRQVHGEGLVLGSSVLSDLKDTFRGDGQEVTLDVVDLGTLDQVPGVVTLDVVDGEFLSGRELGDEGAVMARDQGSAGTGGDAALDVDVLGGETVSLGGSDQLGAELVIGGGTDINDGLCGQQALGTTGSVLGGTSGNIDNIGELDDLFVPSLSSSI